MSIIAIRWAYSQPISNPVAKNILVFLCTHDFPGNTSVFKVSTISHATSYSETAVKTALTELHKTGYIKKQARFGENGQKLSNSYTILVPQEYVQEFMETYELPPTHRRETPVPQTADAPPPRRQTPNYKNNAFKNNLKKSFCADKKENSKKHDFAQNMDQMANESKHIKEHEEIKRAPMPDSLRRLVKSMRVT